MESLTAELDRFEKTAESLPEPFGLMQQIGEALETRVHSIEHVCGMIARLGDQLAKQFQSEEEGGYFRDALVEAPRLISRANKLLLQHPKMTRSVRQLAGAADPDLDPELWWNQTAERFQAFMDEVTRHEQHEDGLMQEVFNRDLGWAD